MRLRYTAILLLVLSTSCHPDYETTKWLVSEKNIDTYLTALQKGVARNNSPPIDRLMLAEIEEYINAKGDVVYSKNPEARFLHKGLIELYRAEFLRSFYTLKTYVERTNDFAQPFYHIGIRLETQSDFSGTDILGQAALATRDLFPLPLDIDQQASILVYCDFYPYLQMGPSLSGLLTEWNPRDLMVDLCADIEYYQDFQLTRKEIETLYGLFILEAEDVEELLEHKSAHDVAELDYLIAFYVHPYHQDFQEAAHYADIRSHTEWYEPWPHSRIENLMRAYLGVDRYDEVLDLWTRHSGRFNDDLASLYHLNLLVSAAYAGLGDLDTSLRYLEKELALAKIYPGCSSSNQMTYDLPDRGDMLVSIFELVFVFEEFDQFEKAGRFGELEAIVENNVARFKHLDLFKRE